MRNRLYAALLVASIVAFVVVLVVLREQNSMLDPRGASLDDLQDDVFAAYSFPALAERHPVVSPIELGEIIEVSDEIIAQRFFYYSQNTRISGMLTRPNDEQSYPVIVMARGYVDKDIYVTGLGTKNAAQYYAKQGFVTLAPDFSGYGESGSEDKEPLVARFSKVVEVLDLLASLNNLPNIQRENVFLWGHSNGGQIMLSTALVIGQHQRLYVENMNYPAIRALTLWAPVTKPFPYSVLFYTDEAEDHGKYLRGIIAEFEQKADVYLYTMDRFLTWLDVPIMIQQGTADLEVPVSWTREFVELLDKEDKEVVVNYYPSADHNLSPHWGSVVVRDVQFFLNNMQK